MSGDPARRGRWIAVEGLDGCGKSTQVTRLAAVLDARVVREPGGTELGAALRELLLHTDRRIDERAEVLLFAADRAELAATVIEPALAAGIDVVSDRSLWSSVAYQGAGRGLGADVVGAVNQFALGGLLPDVVVLIDVDPTVTAARLGRVRDRIEQEPAGFFTAVADDFRRLAVTHDWIVVDGTGDVEEIATQIAAAVDGRLVR